MIENSMFYMNFEVSSDSQKRCVEEIKRIGLDDIMNPIYLLKKPIIDKKAIMTIRMHLWFLCQDIR